MAARLRRVHAHLLAEPVPAAGAVVPPANEIEALYRPLPLDDLSITAEALAAESQHASHPKLYGFVPVLNDAPLALAPAEIARYNECGYTAPIQIYTEAEAAANREYFDAMMGQLEHEGTISGAIHGNSLPIFGDFPLIPPLSTGLFSVKTGAGRSSCLLREQLLPKRFLNPAPHYSLPWTIFIQAPVSLNDVRFYSLDSPLLGSNQADLFPGAGTRSTATTSSAGTSGTIFHHLPPNSLCFSAFLTIKCCK
jgi:hypothetical protein